MIGPREIRVASINVAGVLLMAGIEPIGIMRHERTGAILLRFAGTDAAQAVLNRYNAGRDKAAGIIEKETTDGNADQPQRG